MGPVNMMALEEYGETTTRHAFLETQRKDLLDSIENTVASIKEIDDVSRVKFDEAYKVINENFSVTFAKLFGGGQAFMRLTDPDNPNSDSSGIEIVASPPGKKLQNILLLSGGEKALTALSLLVGIFQFQPAPFCILDEVDAPLDETNVGRYAKMIADMSTTTQFIAITHNKRTMAQADVIYGVTMQEPGVSKNRLRQSRPNQPHPPTPTRRLIHPAAISRATSLSHSRVVSPSHPSTRKRGKNTRSNAAVTSASVATKLRQKAPDIPHRAIAFFNRRPSQIARNHPWYVGPSKQAYSPG